MEDETRLYEETRERWLKWKAEREEKLISEVEKALEASTLKERLVETLKNHKEKKT